MKMWVKTLVGILVILAVVGFLWLILGHPTREFITRPETKPPVQFFGFLITIDATLSRIIPIPILCGMVKYQRITNLMNYTYSPEQEVRHGIS